ncbi:hypothetical protein [Gulosibacter sediminis]|uniref:hypothetical protein n=1 Tax=Gulosibacter sediminis TaxID=1729695 RepID=UPI0024A93FC7|nr:hypothetical protein [Gulosibacter sediminis]
MSNGRKPSPAAASYRGGYLRSRAWFARRARYFQDQARLRCEVCRREVTTPRDLELHHVSYRGVRQRPDGSWEAHEADNDLVAMHPVCHEAVHRILDQDTMLRGLVSRQDATDRAIRIVRRQLERALGITIDTGDGDAT